uniref:Uncharacterized protein n=1 Tax=Arundo donax TaxID=35708 RepID=A0A0A9EHB2_ARUDO
MSSEVAQLLLAHACQFRCACLLILCSSDTTATIEKIGATLQQISCNIISFQNIRKINP